MTEPSPFRRLAIVARGTAALRCIAAARELSGEGESAFATIALFVEDDRRALFVREADESFALGSASFVDPHDGQRKSRYRDEAALTAALRAARADAVWMGWDGNAEPSARVDRLAVVDPLTLAELCARLGIVFVGPALATLRRLAEPAAMAGLCAEACVGLASASARSGDARRLVVPTISDAHGTCWTFSACAATVQLGDRVLLAESPAPILAAGQEPVLRETAARIVRALDYRGAAAVEFHYQPATRLHEVLALYPGLGFGLATTELVTGLDLVKLELAVARGRALVGEAPLGRGHALAVELRAEDPESAFAPAPGIVARLVLPAGVGVRSDAALAEGEVVATGGDAALATIATIGTTRVEARARLRRALGAVVAIVAGGATNKSFLRHLLDRPELAAPDAAPGWLDGLIAAGEHVSHRHAALALVAAAVEAYEAALAIEEVQFFTGAARGRPVVRAELGHSIALRQRGRAYAFAVRKRGPARYALAIDDHRLEVEVDRLGPLERVLVTGAARHRVLAVPDQFGYRIEVDGVEHRITRDDARTVRATAPGIVVTVVVQPGDVVQAGDRLVVLEAMKMELAVTAPGPGRVGRVLTAANVQVDAGTALVVLEPEGGLVEPIADARITFASLAAAADLPALACGGVRNLMLGFDVDAAEVRLAHGRSDHTPDDETALQGAEDAALAIFADVTALFVPRRTGEGAVDAAAAGLVPEEALRAWVRAVEIGVEHLPEAFTAVLARTLAHYGVASFAPAPELRSALLWIHKAHRRRAAAQRFVLAILERRLARVEAAGAVAVSAGSRAVLDRLVHLSEGPATALGDLVRRVRHRYVEQPLYEAARRRVHDEAADALRRLAADDLAATAADELVQSLVECPQPLVGMLLPRFATASPPLSARMLEVLLRRYYRIRSLERVGRLASGTCEGIAGEYVFLGRHIHAFMVYTPAPALAATLRGLAAAVAQIPSAHDVVLDVLIWRDGGLGDAEAAVAELTGAIEAAALPRAIRRVVFALAGPESGHTIAGMRHFTFRPTATGYAEERVSRDLHPMMGKRLQLWRLAHIHLERLPSPSDLYLLRGIARENRKDERLFAFAEVRDVTPLRDEQGAIVQLPELERMFREALAAIRDAQAHRKPGERLHWNRVLLYVWPPLLLSAAELRALAQRLAPATEGLGLEKVVVRARALPPGSTTPRDCVMHLGTPVGRGLEIRYAEPADQPIRPLTAYGQKVVRMRQRGLVYPYEIVRMLAPSTAGTPGEFPPGEFIEHDLDADQRLTPVDRPPGGNTANIVVGVIRNFTAVHPEGMTRVILLGDPSHAMGALAEPECRRINAALDLAEQLRVPLEWVAVSAGAKISMESGTENMDWISLVLRRLIEFTQAGGEVNVLVAGINVGAQPYWNAEATMLMHTRGILVMIADGAMVLTGKSALDYSGGVSAEDNQGIGGYERIMGPNGQAQYWARDVADASRILLRHYEHCYVAPGERFPRSAPTEDPRTRDVCAYPHAVGYGFATVGDVFSDATNPGRKRPFDIRTVMHAAVDQDHPPLERWAAMRDAEIAVVWDACRSACSASSRIRCPGSASCPATARISGPPGRCSRAPRRRWRARSTPPAAIVRWWCSRISRASTARPSRCAICSSSTARRSDVPS